jgi:hydroxylysine kinase
MRNALSTSRPPHFDWGALDARRPGPDAGAVSAALRQRYALDGQLVHLASERDGVYRLDVRGAGAQIVRVSSAAEPEASLLLQNEALRAVARTDPSLPVPRIVASVTGLDVERIETPLGPYRVRVMSYLPGMPVLQSPRSPAMLASIGRTLARLDEALRFVSTVDRNFPLLWDLRSAPRLASFVDCIASASGRAAVEQVLAELESSGLARLSGLPSQVIHNDFNPKNLLFDSDRGMHVVGIIDFGDIVHGARIVDLGVCLARHLEPTDCLAAPRHIIAGYCEVATISEDELVMLPLIVRARLAMRAAIGAWRLRQGDGQADPVQIEGALALLEIMARIDPAEATDRWRPPARL